MTQPSGNAAEVRAALQAIVCDASLGPGVLSDQNLMAGVIKDYLPDAPRETGILLAAVQRGVPDILRERVAGGMDPPTAISVTASWFADITMYAPEASRWAVGELALALGLSTPEEPRLVPQAPLQPQSQPSPQPQRLPPPEQQRQYQLQPEPNWQPQPETQVQPQPPGPGRPGRGRRVLVLAIVGVVVLIAGGATAAVLLLRSNPKPSGPLGKPVASIAASSPIVVGGDVVVAYHGGRNAQATISGSLSRTRAGEVAKLIAVPFPFHSSQARFAGIRSISAGSERVTFSVTPSLETEYFIGVYASSSATKLLASSGYQNVYVTTQWNESFGYASQSGCRALSCSYLTQCTQPECYVNYFFRIYAPPSAIKTEESKRLYFYYGFSQNGTGKPVALKTLSLAPSVTPSVTKIIAPDEYEQVVRIEDNVGNHSHSVRFKSVFCVRDTLSTDGLGLPGHHGCGDTTIPVNAHYLG